MSEIYTNPANTTTSQNIVETSLQRHDVAATYNDVVATLCVCWERITPTDYGYSVKTLTLHVFERDTITLKQSLYIFPTGPNK